MSSNLTGGLSREALRAGLGAIQAEAGGLLELVVVTPDDGLGYISAALAGDLEAARILRAISAAGVKIDSAPRRKPALCACCPRPIRKASSFAFVLALPKNGNPANALSMAVCSRCAVEPAEIQAKAVMALRKLWPDIRPVTITHQAGGRA